EGVGNLGQIELAPYGFSDDAKLLEVHVWAPRSKTRSLELTRRTGWPAARLSSESFWADNSTSKNCGSAGFPLPFPWYAGPLSSTRATAPTSRMRLTVAGTPTASPRS